MCVFLNLFFNFLIQIKNELFFNQLKKVCHKQTKDDVSTLFGSSSGLAHEKSSWLAAVRMMLLLCWSAENELSL